MTKIEAGDLYKNKTSGELCIIRDVKKFLVAGEVEKVSSTSVCVFLIDEKIAPVDYWGAISFLQHWHKL